MTDMGARVPTCSVVTTVMAVAHRNRCGRQISLTIWARLIPPLSGWPGARRGTTAGPGRGNAIGRTELYALMTVASESR
jgi:hypothetical protein